MSSIYLISPAGNPNYGDELIAAGWLRYLAAAQPETHVWLDCPNPGLATELFRGIHPHLHVTNTLWRACWEASSTDPHLLMDEVAALVRNFGSPAYDLGIDRLRKVKSIHVLGGGYLNNLWPANAGLIAGAAAVQSLTGAKLYASGLSVVPRLARLPSDRKSTGPAVIDLLRGFDHVTVRDQASAAVLDLPLGLDDAFLAVGRECQRGLARGGADLVLCLQNDLLAQPYSPWFLQGVRGLIEKALAEGKTVQYVESTPGIDRAGLDALQDLIEPDAFIPFISVWRDGLPLKPDQMWLTTRFHLHFMAAAVGASGTAISIKEDYYDIKHHSLLDLGTGWSYTAHTVSGTFQAPAPALAGTSFTSRLEARIDDKFQEAQLLYPRSHDHPPQREPITGRGARFIRRIKGTRRSHS